MKKCTNPECSFIPDNDIAAFCKKCGAELETMRQPTIPQYELQSEHIPLKNKTEAKWFDILLIALFAAILILGVAIAVVANNQSDEIETALTVDEMIALGEKYLLDLDYEQALVEFLRVIEVEPMNPRGYTGAAEAYIGLEKPNDAKDILEQGLIVLPGNREITDMLDTVERIIIGVIPGSGTRGSDRYLNMSIIQTDSSNFPTVRFYVNIIDENGEVIEGLGLEQFDILELDAAGNWITAEIEEFRQLLATDSMNIGLVIDKSGSMMNYNRMTQARNAASYFLTFLENEGNNLIEITYFDNFIYVPHTFTDSYSTLKDSLYNYNPDGGTALFDALYHALLSTNEQSGAKCVVAFTDGEENSSRCTYDDVVQLANATGIPLYLVGVGQDINESMLKELAEMTGGAYFLAQDSDFEQYLQSIYIDVFNLHRHQYVVQYRSALNDALDMSHNVTIRTGEDSGYTGEAAREYIPVPTVFTVPDSLADAIFNTNNWVRITMHWPDWDGTTPTVFERDKNSPVWTQASRDGYTRIVDADFTQSGDTVYIGIPTTDSKFILEADGTGSLFSERMIWTYETDAGFPLESYYGIDQNTNLQNIMARDALVVIRVYWNNGEYAYFYRNNRGGWQMRGRQGGIMTIRPEFTYSSNSVEMKFSASSTNYNFTFASGGSGTANNESITWNYSFYER